MIVLHASEVTHSVPFHASISIYPISVTLVEKAFIQNDILVTGAWYISVVIWSPVFFKNSDLVPSALADVVVRLTNAKRIYKTVDEVIEDMPQLKALHDKCNLELIDQGTKEPND